VRRTLARRPLRQRVIALVAAYAVAIAGLIASLGAAEAVVNLGDSALCHTDFATPPAPAPDQTNDKICIDYSCCTGCLAMAATVPPPSSVIGPLRLSFKRLDLPVRSVKLVDTKANAHRSRGPPPAL
jgi:hypothetical protein